MAISINTQAFRDSIPSAMHEAASRLRLTGRVGDLEQIGGGVQAIVRDGQAVFQPWVGVVERAFIGECDCAPSETDEWCVHTAALALTAFHDDVTWSGAAIPPSTTRMTPERARYAAAVRLLAPRQLTSLVVDQAAKDRLFAALLLRQAGLLHSTDHDAMHDFRLALREVSNVTNGHRWQIHDVETAGHRLVEEVGILCVHPATLQMLELVEQAIIVWDELSGHLIDAYYVRQTEPEEISQPLVEAHHHLCEQLDIDPAELRERLANLLERCDYDTISMDTYANLLGDHALR